MHILVKRCRVEGQVNSVLVELSQFFSTSCVTRAQAGRARGVIVLSLQQILDVFGTPTSGRLQFILEKEMKELDFHLLTCGFCYVFDLTWSCNVG